MSPYADPKIPTYAEQLINCIIMNNCSGNSFRAKNVRKSKPPPSSATLPPRASHEEDFDLVVCQVRAMCGNSAETQFPRLERTTCH
ncbi:hypothetical protein JTB14_028527 [Gonioctena quinquepunctata]|nr:hypothetical protein JTB14_028527 [Gonioctena quinquepunctata]